MAYFSSTSFCSLGHSGFLFLQSFSQENIYRKEAAVRTDLEKLVKVHELDLEIRQSLTRLKLLVNEENDLNEAGVKVRLSKISDLKKGAVEGCRILKRLKDRREAIINNLPHAVLDSYERIRSHKGIALSKVNKNYCQNCRIIVPYSVLKRVRKGEQLTTCQNCGLILFFHQVEVEQTVGAGK
jgi:uncharacterized protein